MCTPSVNSYSGNVDTGERFVGPCSLCVARDFRNNLLEILYTFTEGNELLGRFSCNVYVDSMEICFRGVIFQSKVHIGETSADEACTGRWLEGRELANQIIATWHRLISLEVWQVGPDAFACESSASRVQYFCRFSCGWNGMQEDKASSISGLDEWSNSIWNIFANNLIYFIISKMQFV